MVRGCFCSATVIVLHCMTFRLPFSLRFIKKLSFINLRKNIVDFIIVLISCTYLKMGSIQCLPRLACKPI